MRLFSRDVKIPAFTCSTNLTELPKSDTWYMRYAMSINNLNQEAGNHAFIWKSVTHTSKAVMWVLSEGADDLLVTCGQQVSRGAFIA